MTSMETPVQESAMTEIALALAMGFFSMMVLTLISMGTGVQKENASVDMLTLAESVTPSSEKSSSEGKQTPPKQMIIIFDGSQFFDAQLNILTVEKINSQTKESNDRIVLAMPPDLSIKDAMLAKASIKTPNLVVSNLDERWLKALEARR